MDWNLDGFRRFQRTSKTSTKLVESASSEHNVKTEFQLGYMHAFNEAIGMPCILISFTQLFVLRISNRPSRRSYISYLLKCKYVNPLWMRMCGKIFCCKAFLNRAFHNWKLN